MIVTAPRLYGTVRTTPHGVSVFTADDIRRSAATSVADVLSRAAGLNLHSFFGSDKSTRIDMRGMGDTATSNVLIMVDGVRLNELDLSGADLSTVALSQIERIEVVRGGGSVVYGDGAVAGVVNIITKRSQPESARLSVELGAGSYGMDDMRIHASGGSGPVALFLNMSQLDTEGFRRNGDLRSRNVSGEVRFFGAGELHFLDAYLRASHHKDAYGLPGPVNAVNFAAGTDARRGTNAPNDRGQTEDITWTAGAGADLGWAGRLEVQSSFRDRRNDFVIGFSPLIALERQRSIIVSKRLDLQLRYDKDFRAFGGVHSLGFGLNEQDGTYARYSNGRYVPDQSEQRVGEVRAQGAFATLKLRLNADLEVTAGMRENRFSTRMATERFTRRCVFMPFPIRVCTPYVYTPQSERATTWHNQASEVGISWRMIPGLTGYASATRHFRNPNLDELAQAAVDLRPQSGRTTEAGLRYSKDRDLEVSVGVFEILNNSEIYFGADPASGLSANRNYELPTRRRGVEFEGRWQATRTVMLRANGAVIEPRFVGVNADIPHVPRHTANAGLEWRASENTTLSGALRYVGMRFDGNDFTNRTQPPLPRYLIVDAALRVGIGAAELTVGINNLTNRAYSTLGYSATYYPMPERNAFVRLRFGFP
ncbi:MAG: TonB-dependent receptor [Burkholderiales bacterium]